MYGKIASEILDLRNPTVEDIKRLLEGYVITPICQSGVKGFQEQITYFLGAKRSEGLSAKTLSNYGRYLTSFGDSIRKKAEKIVVNDIRGYISKMSDKGLKESTIQTIINILRSFFSWLTIEEIISKNPMLKIKSLKTDKMNARKGLSLEEIERLRNACVDYREKFLVEFFYSTGCRLSEALQYYNGKVVCVSRIQRVSRHLLWEKYMNLLMV